MLRASSSRASRRSTTTFEPTFTVRNVPMPSPSSSTGAPSAFTNPPKSPTSSQTASGAAAISPSTCTCAMRGRVGAPSGRVQFDAARLRGGGRVLGCFRGAGGVLGRGRGRGRGGGGRGGRRLAAVVVRLRLAAADRAAGHARGRVGRDRHRRRGGRRL